MKNILILCVCAIVFNSCMYDHTKNLVRYPRYKLESFSYVPAEHKAKYRAWITETVKASNQNLTAGNYSDIHETIQKAKDVADNIFMVKVLGLRKEIDDNYQNDILLPLEDMSKTEKTIFNVMSKSKK